MQRKIILRHRTLVPAVFSVVTLLSACAVDPQSVGSGQYLQLLQSGKVVLETDTSNAGMLNCPNTAYRLMQEQPAMVGQVKCSSQPTSDPLPFSFRAHRQLTESDEYRRATPYLTRTATSQLCVSNRQATSKLEKTVVLEDRCGSPAAIAVPPQQSAPAAKAAVITPKSKESISERLKQLDQLRGQNLITAEEYAAKRRSLLEEL